MIIVQLKYIGTQMNIVKSICFISLISISFSSFADTYMGLKIGKSWLDDACLSSDVCDTDDSKYATVGGIVGFNMHRLVAIEAAYDYLGQFTASGVDNKHIQAITLAPKFNLSLTENINLFTKLGGAFVDYGNKNDYSYLVGLGLEFDVSDKVSLRLEYQRLTDINNDLVRAKANSSTLGVVYKFISEPEKVLSPPVERAEEVITYTEPEVNIFDAINFVMSGFNFDSAVLSAQQEQQIVTIIDLLQQYPMAMVEIVGHTDSIGATAYNKKLSEKRAQVVFERLVNKGINESRISFRGAGASEPIATNTTSAGRNKNRRVVIIIPSFEY